jgi:hypothetical protein
MGKVFHTVVCVELSRMAGLTRNMLGSIGSLVRAARSKIKCKDEDNEKGLHNLVTCSLFLHVFSSRTDDATGGS